MANAFHERVWYYTIDPELRIIHAFRDCADARVANKYRYATEFVLREPHHAVKLDHMIAEERYKICHRCYRTEQTDARRVARPVRPGFLAQPPGYREPEKRATPHRQSRKNVVRD